ncbi:hypothetical protein ABIB40_004062 [Pedobacter sp. UYP30]|uniref:DUF3024 domain-containing protein n=1 Tax=Pedobacter sp. UYP30 TaxID=1756400 RepID=UPI0033943B87
MTKNAIDANEAIIKKYADSKRPDDLEMRAKLDFGYSYDGQVAIFFEIRPVYLMPDKIIHPMIAKIRFYKSKEEWNLYWMRASGKWELYEPFPKSKNLEKLIEIIDKDNHGCFFG